MRIFVLISAGLIFSGCALLPSAPDRSRDRTTGQMTEPFVTLTTDSGRVAKVDPDARFAVVTFPLGGVPGPGRRLSVYRSGIKVGELKITGPQRENNTVADIVFGEVQMNDEARVD